MNPSSSILIISLIVWLFPQKAPGKHELSEKETKNNTSVSVSLHLNSTSEQMNHKKNTTLEKPFKLSPDYFEEDPLQIEEWMNSPESWNTKQDL